jgi:serine phosphatase RsbU (regulator of sigma subunit)
MAHLLIRKGPNIGHRLRLMKNAVVVGRSPDCDLTVPSPSISRQHARLLLLQETWHIEDMKSRNGTHVNGQLIQERTPLKHNDRIRICDFEADFLESAMTTTAGQPPTPAPGLTLQEEAESSSNLAAMVTHASKVLELQPIESLRTILEVNNRFSTTLELDQLLPRIADNLLQLFPQADRCFIVLQDETSGDLLQQIARTRKPDEEHVARYSRSVVRQCKQTGKAFLTEDVTKDPLSPSQSSLEMRIRSVMCTPFLNSKQQFAGAIQLDTVDIVKKFATQDLRLFIGVVNQAGIALQNARLYQEMQKREQIERDLELAAQVQQSILPDRVPQFPGYQFFAHYASALEVGGDYFDFIPLPQQRLAVALGDVAGKSVPAAILMAKLSSDVRTCLLNHDRPAEAMTALNQLLYRNLRQTDRWVTLSAAVLDLSNNKATLVNAGHCMPLLYRSQTCSATEAMVHSESGVPLGVSEAPVYIACELELQPGDSLILFTDGVLDALNSKDQPFRIEGVYESLRGGGPYAPEPLGQRIVKAVENHSAGRSQYDDITLLSFGRLP